jgi:phosphohistidine phosphatase
MKTLSLIRHASSGSDEMSLSDRARPLDPRGERDLAQLARICAGLQNRPDLIVSSPAVRALSTARAIAEGFGQRGEDIRIDDRVYAGSARALLDIVERLDDSLDHVTIVGHNPELLELGQHLAPGIAHLPTSSMATLEFDTCSWLEVPRLKAMSVSVETPRTHGATGTASVVTEANIRA